MEIGDEREAGTRGWGRLGDEGLIPLHADEPDGGPVPHRLGHGAFALVAPRPWEVVPQSITELQHRRRPR
jgi:hypothetical protein